MITIVPDHLIKINETILPQKIELTWRNRIYSVAVKSFSQLRM